MNKRRITYLLFTLALICTLSVSYFWKRSPIARCHNWAFSSVEEKSYAYPEKIVVKPWKGPHHVYGLFMIPGGHLNEKLFKLTIPNTRTYCGVLEFNGSAYGSFEAKPGYYIMRGLLNTRIALWLILQGRGEELKRSHNWQVGYSKTEKKK
ncbi:MAG: hypothetical protein AAF378_21515 [Cyanobacteria bacterium P01_A01_bin.84]